MKIATFLSVDGYFAIRITLLDNINYTYSIDKILIVREDYKKEVLLNKFLYKEYSNAEYNILIDNDKVFTKDEIFDILNKLCPYEKQVEGRLIRANLRYFTDIKKGYEIRYYSTQSELINIKDIEYFSDFGKECVYDKNKIKKYIDEINESIDNEISRLVTMRNKYNALIGE